MLYVRLYTNWHTLKESTFNLPRKYDFFFFLSRAAATVEVFRRIPHDSLGFVYFLFILLSALQKWGAPHKWIDGKVEQGREGGQRGRWVGGWVGGWQGRKKKLERKTDKECQALKTGMLLLCVCHLATSPPHHLPPASPSPAALSNSTNLLRNVWLLF